jgi:hypothetical protein
MKVCALILLALLGSAGVQAGAPAGETRLQLVGEARLEVLFWSIYDSRLYSADGSYTEGQRPVRLELQYLRDVEGSDLVEHTHNEWQHLQLRSESKAAWLDQLAAMWPDVRENDVLAMEIGESGRSTFTLNGEALGSISDPEFGPSFLAIWLSPDTSQPGLRRDLIGMN